MEDWSIYLVHRLKTQLPDIKTSLDIVKHLQSKKVSFCVCKLVIVVSLHRNLIIILFIHLYTMLNIRL